MSNPFNILKPWKPGDVREVTEKALKNAQIEGRYDSYARIYQFDGVRWRIQDKMSKAAGETVYTLVCVNE